ncbi:N-acetylmuramoyl-L-alanine amidase [Mastigocoleus testarum]|uniref:N-acetylmuramoyl-L-alanine amidase n=1 Tax=Mastigocoleus testarum TaxID=996925 RepID=UPI0003F709AF|nr:peptidoglycan recognition family protein [Mastigocoleus testarum]
MNFNIWLKRLLIISLLITSLLLAVLVGNKSKTEEKIAEVQPQNTIETAWNPSQTQLFSHPIRKKEAPKDNISSNSANNPNLKVKSSENKLKQNKPIDNSRTDNKITENKISNKQKLSQQENKSYEQNKSYEKNKYYNQNRSQVQQLPTIKYQTTQYFQEYKPKYTIALADPSNYGDRYPVDVNGLPLRHQPIVVIHETSNSASSAINTFKTHHTNDSQQVSYHALITLDGTVVYLVPPEKRAYGAGNSVFEGSNGIETVKTNPNLPPSVNNFAYHVSLETPVEAHGKYSYKTHSGYTDLQYKSLAWLLAQSDIPDERITTHYAVDRSGQRIDPRSFDFNKFFDLLHQYRQPVLASSQKQEQEAVKRQIEIYDPA